jgi:hypothetical protein
MEASSWETTIRTGSYEGDQQALAQCETQARAQGLTLRTTQLPGGGFHVAAVSPPPPGPPQGSPYGAAPNPYVNPSAYGNPAPNPYVNAGGYGSPAPNPYAGAAQSPYGGPSQNPYAAPSPYAPPGAFGGGAPYGVQHQHGGGYCDQCGVRGPVKRSTFMQNIGMLVIRFPRTRQGNMCRRCIDQYFWSYTLVTSFLGWWGMISFVYSLISIPPTSTTT